MTNLFYFREEEYNAQQPDVELSGLVLENVEALASDEGLGDNCRWERVYDSHGCVYHNCVSNGDGNMCSCGATEG